MKLRKRNYMTEPENEKTWTMELKLRSRPESGCMKLQPKAGGKLQLRLNTTTSPIANKYREGQLIRTLKREFKSEWNRWEENGWNLEGQTRGFSPELSPQVGCRRPQGSAPRLAGLHRRTSPLVGCSDPMRGCRWPGWAEPSLRGRRPPGVPTTAPAFRSAPSLEQPAPLCGE